MQLFDENPKRKCACNEAIKKGIFTKSISNDSFCIYGNLMQGKSVLLNYNGKLLKNIELTDCDKNKIPNLYLYYCYDNNWNDKKIVNMNICNQNSTLSYCSIIDIPDLPNTNINIAFTNDKDEWDTDIKGTYYLKIYPDIEKSIMKRYGFDSTPPAIMEDKSPAITFNKIKERIVNIFSLFGILKKENMIM